MSEPIPIATVMARKICARLERALSILESVDEGVIEFDLVEVASAVFEAQQTILRLTRARQEMWSNSPSWTSDT
ncbi:hypothetical protein [uncultured Rhodoblastus sp.]|uniref:hypothetical protein n=1 Tax=uncultured Rhodoblastus sp. TaxID=543037 RepID=UPI0025EB983D|nr:hypothetical protein [uncultured Rhodoblastus sp.]